MHVFAKGLAGTAVMALILLGGARTASAQWLLPWTDKGFVNVSFGGQTQARSNSVNGSKPLYEETATWGTGIGVGSGGIFDISGGWRIWSNLAVGLGFHSYSDTSSTVVEGTIPDPLDFDLFHPASFATPNLRHRERAVHLSAVWMLPVTDKIDVAVFAGPSFFSLRKGVPVDITIPDGGTTISGVAIATVSKRATGGHVGVDVTYVIFEDALQTIGFMKDAGIVPDIGAGFFLRYGAATADVPEVNERKVKMGGFNYGFGLRIQF